MRFDRIHAMPPIDIRFTHSSKKYRKWMKRFGSEPYGGNSLAETATAVADDGCVVFMVWMDDDLTLTDVEDAAILAHEATHIADHYCTDLINEQNPGDELRAYVVQYATKYLLKRHRKWKRKAFRKAAEKKLGKKLTSGQ